MSTAPRPVEPDPDRDLATLTANLRRLIDHHGLRLAARYSGFTEEGLRLIRKGERRPGLETFVYLVRSLGVDPSNMFVPEDEFAELLRAEELVPFFVPPRPATSRGDSASASSRSSAAKARRDSKMRAKGPWLISLDDLQERDAAKRRRTPAGRVAQILRFPSSAVPARRLRRAG